MIEISKVNAKEYKYLMNRLQRAGHSVELRGSGHYLVKHSSGKGMVTLPATPSSPRSYQNSLSQLKRQGFQS